MEDDIIFLGHGSQNNLVPLRTTQENGQQDIQNYPGPVRNHNVEPHNDGIPVDFFRQPPAVPDDIAAYDRIQGLLDATDFHSLVPQNLVAEPVQGIVSCSDANRNSPPPVPASTSRQELNNDQQKPVSLRRNPSRSVKKVSSSNTIGPNGTYISPPKAPVAKKSRTKPQVVRKSKIQKVDEPAIQAPREEPSYHRLLELQESDLVPSSEAATCPVCHFGVPPGNGVVLKDCLHTFCRNCLSIAIQESQTAQVRCPFVCEEYSCESHLQDREVKCLVSPEDYELHLARSVFQAQCQATNAFHCVVPGCIGWCLIETGDTHPTWFMCPICVSKNCIPCRAVHNSLGCPREEQLEVLPANNFENEVQEPIEAQRPDDCRSLEELTDMGLLTSTEDHPADYRNLLQATDMGLVTNTERFECPICFSDIPVGEGVTLKDCLHNYCRECLTGTIRHSEMVLVKCPFVNNEYSCESFLQEREIKSLLTPEEFERHLAMSLALVERQSANSFHCKTPDCAGWCLVEDDANQFFCHVCQHSNCLSCAAIHEGKNCKQYQDMAAFHSDMSVEGKKTREYLERQLKGNKAMACPTCQVIVMKREGCDWLVCSMCRTEICWATKGPRWGPGGNGDTSGGCKCRLNGGKRCHPHCYNCH